MTPWDDVEVDSDGDEMLDWLWDLPDRYDVGIDDNPTAPGVAVDGAGQHSVRKRVRRPGDALAAADAPEAPAELQDDRPTEAVDLAEPFYEPDFGGETIFAPVPRRESRSSRYTTRELATAAAVIVAVIAVAGIGYALVFSRGSSSKNPNLAIGNPGTTTATTVAGVVATPGAATTSPTDTTTIPPDTTTSGPPATDSGSAAVIGGFTSTTVHQCFYTVAFRLSTAATTVPATTTPPTTTPPTTATTTPPTTTPPTTVPPTTVPPTTVPPTTVTTAPPTTLPPTTVTTRPSPPPTNAPPPGTTIPKLVCR